MVKTIKLFDGVGIMSHGEYLMAESVKDLFDILNINGSSKQIEKQRNEITRSLIGMGYCVLTGSDGFPVFLQIIPTKVDEEWKQY